MKETVTSSKMLWLVVASAAALAAVLSWLLITSLGGVASVSVPKIRVVASLVAGLLVASIGGSALLLWLLQWERRTQSAAEGELRRVNSGAAGRLEFQDRSTVFIAKESAVIALVEMENLGAIKDRHGHACGDVMIKVLMQRISAYAEALGGFSGSYSDGQIAVLLPLKEPESLGKMFDDLIAAWQRPVAKGGVVNHPILSVGVTHSQDAANCRLDCFEALLNEARFALHVCLANGGGGFTLYNQGLEVLHVDQRAATEDLPNAIKNEDLDVHFQPKVDIRTGEITGFEALVRWKRSGLMVPALELIRIAEESGRILDLDRYMLDRATAILADWNRRRKTAYSVSVNISALHLNDISCADAIKECLLRNGLAADLLTIEITETSKLEDKIKAGKALDAIRAIGCRISIDDFGTGYSSLSYLRAISADEIKVDKSLIDEIEVSEDARIVLRSVLELANKLGMDVVIEGVERQEQANLLSKMGCGPVQGYLYGRPRPAGDWLADVTYGTLSKIDAA